MLSICLATYNGLEFLPRTLPLIMNQLSPNDEFIIIDDASTDTTLDYLKQFQSSQVKIFKQKINQGSTQTFFNAIKIATHDIIVLADQDDLWYDDKLMVIRDIFFNNPQLTLFIHDANITISDKMETDTLFKKRNSGLGFYKNLKKNSFIGCCMVFRKSNILINKPFLLFDRKIYHDYFIGMMAILKRKEIVFSSKLLINHIRHNNNTTAIKTRFILQIILERFLLLINLFLNFLLCERK